MNGSRFYRVISLYPGIDLDVICLCLCTSNILVTPTNSISFSLECPFLWLIRWSIHMSNSVQISLGRRCPRFLFHIVYLLCQSPSSLFWMSISSLFFAISPTISSELSALVPLQGRAPEIRPHCYSTRPQGIHLPYLPGLLHCDLVMYGQMDSWTRSWNFVSSKGVRIVSIHVGPFQMFWHSSLHLQENSISL